MTEIHPRTFKLGLYLALRHAGFAWWHCLRIMWHGADLSVVEV